MPAVSVGMVKMNEDWAPGERGRAMLLAGVLLGAVLYPIRQNWSRSGKVDGFPLSYYPMFSAKRKSTFKVAHGVGIHADDSRHNLPGSALGTGGLNQVRRQLRRVVREERVEAFAKTVAARISTWPELEDVVRVEIVDGEYDIDASFLGHTVVCTDEEVLGAADVVRIPQNQPSVAGTGISR